MDTREQSTRYGYVNNIKCIYLPRVALAMIMCLNSNHTPCRPAAVMNPTASLGCECRASNAGD
jgi:hypothetical protein